MKAYNGLYPYAFMSYSHKDEGRIKGLIDRLQSVGCNIWYDEGILPADEWAETIAKKLAGAKLFFLILSKNSIESQNVKREIYYAVSNDIPILTFYLEKVELSHGIEMQLGISQAIHSNNDVETDCKTIKSTFPTDAVSAGEPEIIYSTPLFLYGFMQENNQYSIIRINRETRERKVMFCHKDSKAFCAWYNCESKHFSPSDEFNPDARSTIFFSVYSDLDHDIGVPASDLYVQADFAIVNPETEYAELKILGGRQKKKQDPMENTIIFTDLENCYWLKNCIDN